VKEFALQRLRLTDHTVGKRREDVPSIVRAIGGLQYGGHNIELFNRFKDFKPEWFEHWYRNRALVEGHVLRGALRVVNVDEYPYYFKATRCVSRRRTYQKCPLSLNDNHSVAFNFIHRFGPFTPSEFEKTFGAKYADLRGQAKKLLYDLYNYGRIARIGRRRQKPLYHAVEKLPHMLDMSRIDEKEVKKWLFLKCLSIYGPFTVKDVSHWVGWTMAETRNTLNALLKEEKVVNVNIEGAPNIHFVRREDTSFLSSLKKDLPEHSFIRILFNDDALLLGYYKRLKEYFGYHWKYPQLSEGIAWRAAMLHGRQLLGEAIVDMYAKSRFLQVKRLTLRKEFATSKMLSKIEEEFSRHAEFQSKTLKMTAPKTI